MSLPSIRLGSWREEKRRAFVALDLRASAPASAAASAAPAARASNTWVWVVQRERREADAAASCDGDDAMARCNDGNIGWRFAPPSARALARDIAKKPRTRPSLASLMLQVTPRRDSSTMFCSCQIHILRTRWMPLALDSDASITLACSDSRLLNSF